VADDWDLNPDTLLAPTSSTVTIAPTLTSGTGPVTLTSATGSAGVTLALTNKTITSTTNGLITIKTPSTPGLYSFTVTGEDSSGIAQSQQGWVLATVPASTLTKTGDNQTAAPGATITLTATYTPGASASTGATAGNVDLLFTASAGTLSQRIVRTASNGTATVQLTLPSTAGKVTVTATGPVFWGTPTAMFTAKVE
jgi:adhesin/invasin